MESNKGLASLIVGIVSMVLGALGFWVSGWFGLPSIICGIVGIVLSSKPLKGEKKLIPGLGLASSLIGLIIGIIVIVLLIWYVIEMAGQAAA